jgi:hypothetical protein
MFRELSIANMRPCANAEPVIVSASAPNRAIFFMVFLLTNGTAMPRFGDVLAAFPSRGPKRRSKNVPRRDPERKMKRRKSPADVVTGRGSK